MFIGSKLSQVTDLAFMINLVSCLFIGIFKDFLKFQQTLEFIFSIPGPMKMIFLKGALCIL